VRRSRVTRRSVKRHSPTSSGRTCTCTHMSARTRTRARMNARAHARAHTHTGEKKFDGFHWSEKKTREYRPFQVKPAHREVCYCIYHLRFNLFVEALFFFRKRNRDSGACNCKFPNLKGSITCHHHISMKKKAVAFTGGTSSISLLLAQIQSIDVFHKSRHSMVS